MSIPKIIHYCWFGRNELPPNAVRCIDSWQRFCPDYEIIEWNEDHYDVQKISYIRDAYKEKKWAFVADYVRLDVLYRQGGIYLDTDVELIKSLDPLLEHRIFFGLERHDCCINTGLGFGAEPGNGLLKQLMDVYGKLSFYNRDGSLNLTGCPVYTTDFFMDRGFEKTDMAQEIEGAVILPSEYLCPLNYFTGKCFITENTYGIHRYEASWFPKSDRHIHGVEKKLRNIFPGVIAKAACLIYRKIYRLFEYAAKGILPEKIKEKIRKERYLIWIRQGRKKD